MKQTRILMNMPVTVEIVDLGVTQKDIDQVYEYFQYIDNTFSTFKPTSEISKINIGELSEGTYSQDMKTVLQLSEETKEETDGYFDIFHNGKLDPSGLVKGWAIYNAAQQLQAKGFMNFYLEAGGDIQVNGKNGEGKSWRIGIRNPFNTAEIVRVAHLQKEGIATSGTYERGQHVYNPKQSVKNAKHLEEIVSLTVIGPNIYEADRFATAAFAMQKEGIFFIEKLPGFEAYMIDKNGIGTMTTGFHTYTEAK